MNIQEPKRIYVKIKCPNPLFEKWITDWRDKAIAKDSKMQYTLNTALGSLKKYPLPLERGMDCKILKGFGNKLCKMLDDKLAEQKKLKPHQEIDIVDNEYKIQTGRGTYLTSVIDEEEYIPQYGSGSYAILMALYTQSLLPDYPGFLKKSEIIQHGTHFVNNSFTKPDFGTRYNAWSSMKTLIPKKLVSKVSHPAKYSLTSQGSILANKLYKNYKFSINNIKESNNVSKVKFKNPVVTVDEENVKGKSKVMSTIISRRISDSDSPVINIDIYFNKGEHFKNGMKDVKMQLKKFASESDIALKKPVKKNPIKKFPSALSTISEVEEFTLTSGNFDIILIVDIKEVAGKQDDEVLMNLRKHNVLHEVKDLKVGDFTWICRDHYSVKELVLPYIIERKRMDDFASSIKDKRYHEQKFRLKRSGIENLTYLVESHGKNQHLGLPLQTLYQSATYTAIQENFFIQFTDGLRDSIEYLVNLSGVLKETFQGKTLKSCRKVDLQMVDINQDTIYLMTFKEFNEYSVKNKRMNVTDLFVKMLVQIKGMSVERALAVTKQYPTLVALRKAYLANTQIEGEKLLANIKFGNVGKSIGVVLSRTVYQFFNSTQY